MNAETLDLAARLGRALALRGLSVTAAESCTGGGVASAITDIPGSSGWFEFGFVTYANRAKTDLLGVSGQLLAEQGAVSEAVVRAMAQGARERAGADLAVAVSGVAGPEGGSADKPVGTVWLAWSGPDGTGAKLCHYPGDRSSVRRQALIGALTGLLEKVERLPV